LGVYENYDNSKGRDVNDPGSYDYFGAEVTQQIFVLLSNYQKSKLCLAAILSL
jgi:hypothetical protein